WLADHLFLGVEKYGGPPGTWFGYDPLPALAGVARATSTARVGTLVLCSQLRPAGILAKSLATLDVLAEGRLTIGLGAGWYEPEFAAAGIPFERLSVRLAQLEETIAVLRGLFDGEPFTFHGRHATVVEARSRPRPRQQPGP